MYQVNGDQPNSLEFSDLKVNFVKLKMSPAEFWYIKISPIQPSSVTAVMVCFPMQCTYYATETALVYCC